MLITNQFKSLETLLGVLSTCPKECLYCLINESDRRIQVYSTSNFISHISKLIQELGNLNNKAIKDDIQNIKVLILETEFNNSISRNNRFKQVVEGYKAKGYKFYNDLSVVQYRIRESYRYKNYKAYYVIELLGSKGSKPILVGAFSKYREARAFQDKYYKHGIITSVVFSDSEETKLWQEDYK